MFDPWIHDFVKAFQPGLQMRLDRNHQIVEMIIAQND
jgi:hypothetical protein